MIVVVWLWVSKHIHHTDSSAIVDICQLPLSLSSLWPMAYPMAIDNIYMKYIFASDPIENGGSPSPVPVIATGLLRGVMMNQNQQLGFPLVLQKVASEADPKVRNHGEGPY